MAPCRTAAVVCCSCHVRVPLQVPVVPKKLSWRHAYHKALEHCANLDTSTQATSASFSSAQRDQDLVRARQCVQELEQKHKVARRWAPESPEYQQAAMERKAFNVQLLQRQVSELLDAYTIATAALDRKSTTSSRHEKRRLGTRRSNARSRMRECLQQLILWQAASPALASMGYDASILDVDGIILGRQELPWVGAGASLVSPADDSRQRALRCREEMDLVKREAGDMAARFEAHQHQYETAYAALLARVDSLAATLGGVSAGAALGDEAWQDAAQLLPVRGMFEGQASHSRHAVARLALAHSRGKLALMQAAVERNRLLATGAHALLAKLQAGAPAAGAEVEGGAEVVGGATTAVEDEGGAEVEDASEASECSELGVLLSDDEAFDMLAVEGYSDGE